jgi:predicted Zn-dependent protease
MSTITTRILSVALLSVSSMMFPPQVTIAQLVSPPDKIVAKSVTPEATNVLPHSGSRTNTKDVARLRRKYGLEMVGHRGIGSGMNFYSLEREQRLGRELSQKVDKSLVLVRDPDLLRYLHQLGETLIANSDTSQTVTIRIIRDDEVNAFALPGGNLYVTTGLILFCDDEAELTSAMAHEIAHIAARHGTKQLSKVAMWQFASAPMVAVGIPIGVVMQMVTGATATLSVLKGGRNAEFEADLLGIEYHYLAGYDPTALARLFGRSTGGDAPAKSHYLSRMFASHPNTGARVQRLQMEVVELLPPREQYVVDTSKFQEMKKRLIVLLRGSDIWVDGNANSRRGKGLREKIKAVPAYFLGG